MTPQRTRSLSRLAMARIYRALPDDELAETIAKIERTVARINAGEGINLTLRQRETYRESLTYAQREQQRRRV